MKTISATEFKAKCLDLLDNVPAEGLAITKRGKTVAKLYPEKRGIMKFYGCLADAKVDDDIFSTGLEWDAQS